MDDVPALLQKAASWELLMHCMMIVGGDPHRTPNPGSCTPSSSAFPDTSPSLKRLILKCLDPLEKREYIRFIIGRNDDESRVERGIFQAAAQALGGSTSQGSDAEQLKKLEECFKKSARANLLWT